ncbi:MAG TPA: response regulator [bacterium]|nr:response regulator [bacterium]
MAAAAIKEKRIIKVLVVEDNIGDASLILTYLSDSKIPNKVTVFRNGEEALEYLKKGGSDPQNTEGLPDLILLDLSLPGMDGKEVLRETKKDEILRRIPVVVLTGSRDERNIMGCYESLANYYIIKPGGLTEFIEAMKYVEAIWMHPLAPL